MNVYPFVEAEKAEQDGNVAMACRLLEVSRTAYYEWSAKEPSARELSDAELFEKITEIHKASRGTYGAPRITGKLKDRGVCAGRKRVARLMALHGLVGRCRRRFKKTTIPDPDAETKAIDLICREFGVGVREIDTAWCGDITYVRTWEGWLYLATVIDFASRRVVGFAMAEHMRADLVCDALEMAIDLRRPEPGLIFHSDRGSQYTSSDFRELLEKNGIRQSLSRPRQCWDKGLASHCTSCRRFDQNSTFELASHAFHESRVIGPRRSVEPFVLVVRSEALEQTGLVPLLDSRRADREPLCHLAEVEKPASTQALGVAREMVAAA